MRYDLDMRLQTCLAVSSHSLCSCDASVKVGAYEMGGGWGKENKKTRTRKRGVLARGLRMRLFNPKP